MTNYDVEHIVDIAEQLAYRFEKIMDENGKAYTLDQKLLRRMRDAIQQYRKNPRTTL